MINKLSVVAIFAISSLYAGDIQLSTDVLKKSNSDDLLTANAQVRFGYIGYTYDNNYKAEDFASALGGQVKVETKEWNGVKLGASFYTSHLIRDLSGDVVDETRNYELTGEENSYNIISEAYIAYKVENFTFKVGRQLLDTPYADSDDIRMTPNTFEGAIATYEMGNFTFIGAYLTRWQGADADSYEFVDLLGEDANGLSILATTFANDYLEATLWYYGADKTADVIYADIIGTYILGKGIELKGGLQYANQSEKNNSGIGGTLYGATAEATFSGLSLVASYNSLDVDSGKEYFGGFGGGVGFVNMDEMTAGTFTISQSGRGFKVGVAYDFSQLGVNDLSLSYDYGNFKGDIIHEANEQNLVLSYANSSTWNAELIYTVLEDVNSDFGDNSSDGGFTRVLTRVNYNF